MSEVTSEGPESLEETKKHKDGPPWTKVCTEDTHPQVKKVLKARAKKMRANAKKGQVLQTKIKLRRKLTPEGWQQYFTGHVRWEP